MKYIDAEKLTTIIEERKAQQDQWINRYHDPINQGISNELTEILSIVTSLQQEQPEVELEKAIDDYYHENLGFIIGPNDTKKIVEDIARHFYELGRARKEENK